MPRDPRKVEKRRIAGDYKHNSTVIQRFIHKLNFRGKKNIALHIFYRALDVIKKKTQQDPASVFLQAIDKARPLLEVKPRRVGGATYQVPVEVEKSRSETLVMRWIIQFTRQKKGKPMYQKLAEEVLEISRGEGPVIKKREDTHKMAEANRAFAHYRW